MSIRRLFLLGYSSFFHIFFHKCIVWNSWDIKAKLSNHMDESIWNDFNFLSPALLEYQNVWQSNMKLWVKIRIKQNALVLHLFNVMLISSLDSLAENVFMFNVWILHKTKKTIAILQIQNNIIQYQFWKLRHHQKDKKGDQKNIISQCKARWLLVSFRVR